MWGKCVKTMKNVGFYYTLLSGFFECTIRWGNDNGGRKGDKFLIQDSSFFF